MSSHVSVSQMQTSHFAARTFIVALVALAVLSSAAVWVHSRATGVGLDAARGSTKTSAARTAIENVTAVSEPSESFAPAAPGRTQQMTSTGQTPDGLAPSDWSSIRAAYEAGRYAVQPASEGGHQARNPGQQWLTRFDGRGFLVQPDAAAWQWGLELSAYGFPGHERSLPAAGTAPQVEAAGSHLAYAWDGSVQEWFVNDARGLEHGFTVNERPAGGDAETRRRGDGEIRTDHRQASPRLPLAVSPQLLFTLAVRGTLRPVVEREGHGVRFVDARGATVVNYAGLKVWDADGKILPARFEPLITHHSSRITLSVDERGARYPLTVDPIAQQAYLKPAAVGTTQVNDLFGHSVAVAGDTVVVGARMEDSSTTGVNTTPNESATDSGAAYVFTRSAGMWTQQAYLKPAAFGTTQAGDNFGFSVAVSGDTVVVGAYQEDSSTPGVNSTPNESASNSGAAYVFTRSAGVWTQQAYLKPAAFGTTQAGDNFGFSVAVSDDTVVVGAGGEDSSTTGVNTPPNESATDSGAAYVFTRSAGVWTEQAYLKAAAVGTTQAGDTFGGSVAVAGDTVVVGAAAEDSSTTVVNSTPNESAGQSGAAYVFTRSAGLWSQQAYLKPAAVGTTQAGDFFGFSVAVSGDTVVVGAPSEDSSTTGLSSTPNESAADAGAAYVFTRSAGVWSQQVYLKPAVVGTSQTGDRFGWSVAVAGGTVAVGAIWEDSRTTGVDSTPNEIAGFSGAAYVFTSNAGVWSQQAYLKPAAVGVNQEFDFFGSSVAVSGDTVVVGAEGEESGTTGVNTTPNESAGDSGATYIFIGAAPSAADSSISGSITTPFGAPLAGAGVQLSGSQARKTITDAAGNYRFDNVDVGGFYTVTPSRANFNFSPFNRSFSLVGNNAEAVFTASLAGDEVNPLDTAEYFVRQQYLDILGREPDETGLNYWSDQILACLSDPPAVAGGPTAADCTRAQRIGVAAAFFISAENQDTGSYLYDVYAGTLARRPAFGEFTADRGQVVGGATLDAAKTTFAQNFVQRAEFTARYPVTMTAEAFVDALIQSASSSAGNFSNLNDGRANLISIYNQSGGDLITSRAAVVRSLADNEAFKQSQYNQAFVLTEYFAYLHRDIDQGGYDFWVNVLNSGDRGNYRGMVCSFITSTEYQRRFSAVVSHSNGECGN